MEIAVAAVDEPPATGLPPLESLERLFPEYSIEGLFGRGGMGVVYRARHRELGRPVALKILLPMLSRDAQFEARFTREARIMARLSHPHVISLYDVGERDGLLFIAMEFSDGLDLRQLLDNEALQLSDALNVLPQICDSLQFAHDHGVVHRDIKPENVLIDGDLRVRLTDFGLAKLVGEDPGQSRLTGSRQVFGTPHYMAPEQLRAGEEVTAAADIYSVGVLFYEMLTGEPPLGNYGKPSARAGVPARADDVIAKCLSRDPMQRYRSADELKSAIESCTLGRPPFEPAVTLGAERSVRSLPSGARRRDVLWYATLAAVTNCLLLFLPWYDGPRSGDAIYGLSLEDGTGPVMGWHLVAHELPTALVGVYSITFASLALLAMRVRRIGCRLLALPAIAGVAHIGVLVGIAVSRGAGVRYPALIACAVFVAFLWLLRRCVAESPQPNR